MSCEGCEETARAKNRVQEAIIKKAADYAKENNKAVGIYQSTEGLDFIDLAFAYSASIHVLEIVSPHYQPAAG